MPRPEDHFTDDFRKELGFIASPFIKNAKSSVTNATTMKQSTINQAATPPFLVLSGVPVAFLLVASVVLRGKKTKIKRGYQKRLESARNLGLSDPGANVVMPSPSKSPRRKMVKSARLGGQHVSPRRVMPDIESSSRLEGDFEETESSIHIKLPLLRTQ